jgi:hypothetical protein
VEGLAKGHRQAQLFEKTNQSNQNGKLRTPKPNPMKKTILALALAAGLTSFVGSAKANLTYNWSYSGGGVTGSGTLEVQSTLTTSVNDGYEIGGYTGYLITGATGSFQNSNNGYSISSDHVGVINQWGWGNDNLLLKDSLQPDPNGIFFRTSDSNTVGIYQQSPSNNTVIIGDNYGYFNNGYGGSVFSVTAADTAADTAAVPEPSQVAASLLLAAGIAGFAIVKRRKDGSDLEALAA